VTFVALGDSYPAQTISVASFADSLDAFYPPPNGYLPRGWPPIQVTYLGEYLRRIGCQTILTESHYVDRDYIEDLALFYARSLRGYPNYCRRLHFFSSEFNLSQWRAYVGNLDVAERRTTQEQLQASYLGFSVIRPLPGAPVGRTVVSTFHSDAAAGLLRAFPCTRDYQVQVGGFDLSVKGLAFQQQDQGVSACATTALWSAIHSTAHTEGLLVPTPAAITEAGSRYLLSGGRALPSEGLNVLQLCEAARCAGLAPILVTGSWEGDRWQLHTYLRSGFAPVIALQPFQGPTGHAVCAVGMKLGNVAPQTDVALHFNDAATAIQAIYVHDDRLGPYATADLYPFTTKSGDIATAVRIRWPSQAIEEEHSLIAAMVIPLPPKVRLTAAAIRSVGLEVAEATGAILENTRPVSFGCRYYKASDYRRRVAQLGLSTDGLYSLMCESVWSRYVGVIEVSGKNGNLFDVILDATETSANPFTLACVRTGTLSQPESEGIRQLVAALGTCYLT
jgi:hypothetical protein